ncbi:DUF1800 family protein [Sungkyunkwania multivorans]|uniref:DUF1800 family protein n=1 Tax=Sungkyunkwania multivorans TaxID=1173618 RepID=A0ABW3D0H3_9FLAO
MSKKMTSKEIKHLYWRAGFGSNVSIVRSLDGIEREKLVDELFTQASNFERLTVPTPEIDKALKDKNLLAKKDEIRALIKQSKDRVGDLNSEWIKRICTTEEPLRERMTLFWANHFVCRDLNILHIQQYNNTLRKYALGNFRDFVKAISREASMIKYLNNKQNRKDQPNENFARELMELFTLGRGQYSETDIKEAARAFTGWNHDFRGAFRFVMRQHDYEEKTFFGKTGNFDGEDIIDLILEKRECAAFICRKIYAYFVNDNVSEDHLRAMTDVFYADYDIEKLMRYVFNSDWFYDNKNIGGKIKSPMDLLAGMYRTVPFKFNEVKQLRYIQNLLGQILLYPPNVAGWEGGRGWINANTMMVRMRLSSILLNNGFIAFDEKGAFEDSFKKRYAKRSNLKRRLNITADWEYADRHYGALTHHELRDIILNGRLTDTTRSFLNTKSDVPKKEFLIQLMSLPEYQLC